MSLVIPELWQDARYSIRQLCRTPLFGISVILSLALGIGLNIAVFTFLNALFLKPLPGVVDPAGLISVYHRAAKGPRQLPVSYPNYLDFARRSQTFSDLAAYRLLRVGLATPDGEVEEVAAEMVTTNYFRVVGARPVLGRPFLDEENRTPGTHPVALLSHATWRRRFDSDPGVVGRKIVVNGHSFEVIGVMAEGFKGTFPSASTQLWVPLMMYPVVFSAPEMLESRSGQMLQVLGRLKPGVGLPAAAAEMVALADRLEEEHPESNRDQAVVVSPLVKPLSLKTRAVRSGAFLMIVVGLLLLIVCVNVANLLLARALVRRQEFAVRLSLGATRGRLLRQLLTEGLLLSLLGGAAGLLTAKGSQDLLWRLRPPYVDAGAVDARLDSTVLAFSLAVSLGAGLLIGLFPMLQTRSSDLMSAIRGDEGARWLTRRRFSLSHLLVVVQVALCSLALVCAGLFLKSLGSSHRIDPGFDVERLASVSFDLQAQGLDEPRGRAFQQQLLERAAALPGVESAALSENRLLGGFRLWREVAPEGGADDEKTLVGSGLVSPEYFRTTGIRLLSGRGFTSADRVGTAAVGVVNESLAKRFWPGADPLGKRLRVDEESELVVVVGVAEDSKYITLDEDPTPFLYLATTQRYAPRATLTVRATGDPGEILSAVKREARALEGTLPLVDVLTMEGAVRQALWAPRAGAALLSILGLLALTLSSFGVYAITACSAVRRRPEIGIRMALGAHRLMVVKTLVTGGMAAVGVGLCLGLGSAYLVSQAVSRFLYGVGGQNLATFAGTALLLVAVGALANLMPAVRAARMNPSATLRRGG